MNWEATLQKGSWGLEGVVAAMRTHLFPLQSRSNNTEIINSQFQQNINQHDKNECCHYLLHHLQSATPSSSS
jgi:hypothetical protein